MIWPLKFIVRVICSIECLSFVPENVFTQHVNISRNVAVAWVETDV